MNAMIDKKDIRFRIDKLKYIYENTKEKSRLRQFFCDSFALTVDLGDQVWWGAHKDEYPPDFLIDVIQQLHWLRTTKQGRLDSGWLSRHRNRYLSSQTHQATIP